jgi:pimeloyl-ACP methyl ester carboxylesterase
MRILRLVLGWSFSLLFGLFALSMFLLGNWIPALLLLVILLLCLPPMTRLVRRQLELAIHPGLRVFLVITLLFLVLRGVDSGEAATIYRSPAVRARMMMIYEAKMKEWPVPYESRFLQTRYGAVHVLASGPEDAQPLLLLHASGVGSWSWKENVGPLSRHFRVYAVDLIGDAGRSEYYSLENTLKNRLDQAALYREITDKLNAPKAHVVGASEGGFVGTNYALYAPDRVGKLVLLAPMGYRGSVSSILRITVAQLFPLRPVQAAAVRWAFGESEAVRAEVEEWFTLLLSGVSPVKVPPLPLSKEERSSLPVPVLFVFGERDALLGDPWEASRLVRDIPNAQVRVVEAGHLMAAEIPGEINDLLLEFLLTE